MPFTPSHAVVALPFIRTPLVPAAIAIGAMTPDLPLFVRRIVPSYAVTHDLRWLPVTMVMALVLLLVWRCALRPAARELSPAWLADRLPRDWDAGARHAVRETFPSARGSVLLLASLVIGVATHILWDLFTHEGRWGVSAVPVLDEQWGPFTGYKWLQYGSSALGLVILGVWGILWLRRRTVSPLARTLPAWVRWAWWVSLPVALVVAGVWGVTATGPLTDDWTLAHIAYLVLPPACGVWGALTLVLAILVQAVRVRAVRS